MHYAKLNEIDFIAETYMNPLFTDNNTNIDLEY